MKSSTPLEGGFAYKMSAASASLCLPCMLAALCRRIQELRTRLATLSEASSELAQLRSKCYAVVHELQTAMADVPAALSADILGPEHLPELARELLSQLQVGEGTVGLVPLRLVPLLTML